MEISPSPAARQAQHYLPHRKYVTPGGVTVEHYAHCIYATGTRAQLDADPVLRAFLPPADRPRLRRNGLRGFTSRVDGVCWMRLDPVRLRFHDKPTRAFSTTCCSLMPSREEPTHERTDEHWWRRCRTADDDEPGDRGTDRERA